LTSTIKVLLSSDKKLFLSIKNIFGFYPGNIFLYKLAFRHKSAARETIKGLKVSNERLEYLGDAVLGSAVADFLFKKFPYKDEGFLTEMRSKIVNRGQLNRLSKKLGLDKFLESENDSKTYCKSINGDAFEAFIGALYLDKGYNYTKKIIINRIINVHLDIDDLQTRQTNFKSKLIEWSQKEKKEIEFKVVDEIGEGYKKQYLVQVFINNKALGKAQDYSIKGAEQIAAEKTFKMISKEE
jgi:ribonuclease III